MLRRNFLKTTSLAGLALPTLLTAGCITSTNDKKDDDDDGEKEDDGDDKFELNEITIGALQDKMKSGAYTSRSVCELYLKRIDEIDKKGPKLNAVIELNP